MSAEEAHMDIGRRVREIVVEPIENPVPEPIEPTLPEPVPTTEPEPEKVGA
jgi:hypothetical protein